MKKNLPIIILSIIFSVVIWASVTLSGDFYSTVTMPVKFVDLPAGFSVGEKTPHFVTLKLKGKGWKIASLSIGKQVEYIVPVEKRTGKVKIDLLNAINDNSWIGSDLQITDIFPREINFFIDEVGIKKIPVEPELELKFKSGYGLASPIEIIPDSVLISGSKSVLKEISNIQTEKTVLELDESSSEVVSLQKFSGLSVYPENVTIKFNVQQVVEKEFISIPVKVENVPPDRSVVLNPGEVTISVKGGIDILGKLSNEDFKVYTNYIEMLRDTLGSIIPVIELPANTTLNYLKPDRIKFIIKKF